MNKEGIKILLVEDDEDDAFFIKDLIAERELNPRPLIKHALNPQSALDFLNHTYFDVCLFDLVDRHIRRTLVRRLYKCAFNSSNHSSHEVVNSKSEIVNS